MKKALSIIAVLAGLSFSAIAQDVKTEPQKEVRNRKNQRVERVERKAIKTPEEYAKLKTERLDKMLKLTESQKKEVYALEIEKSKKMHAKRQEMKAHREAQRKEFKAGEETFKNLLTPEQQEVYKNKLAENRKSRFHRGGKDGKYQDMRRRRPDHTKPVIKDSKDIEMDSSAS